MFTSSLRKLEIVQTRSAGKTLISNVYLYPENRRTHLKGIDLETAVWFVNNASQAERETWVTENLDTLKSSLIWDDIIESLITDGYDGSQVILVFPQNDKLVAVNGNTRTLAANLVNTMVDLNLVECEKVEYLPVEGIENSPEQILKAIYRGNNGAHIETSQKVRDILTFHNQGKSQKEISQIIGSSVQDVGQLLKLANVGEKGWMLIDAKQITITTAKKLNPEFLEILALELLETGDKISGTEALSKQKVWEKSTNTLEEELTEEESQDNGQESEISDDEKYEIAQKISEILEMDLDVQTWKKLKKIANNPGLN